MISYPFYSKGLKGVIINVTPAEVKIGDEVEITCSFIITSNGPGTIILKNEERQLAKKYEKDFSEIALANGGTCAMISYLIRKATLADAGFYKCLATGHHESLQYEEATYDLIVLGKI